MHYYNDNDPNAAAWLRELIKEGLIPEGEVDVRSIEDVAPEDVRDFRQAHWFGGIGGWPYALRLAGWPDDWPVWTGSCPCQPYSAAGARGGDDDPRALWWAWRWLIDQCRPPVVFGEQVASKAGREWLSGVRADLEAMGYEVGAADLCAAGVGAPHIRQRLWFVAERMEDTESFGRRGRRDGDSSGGRGTLQVEGSGSFGGRLADSDGGRCQQRYAGQRTVSVFDEGGAWDDYVWVECTDGKQRRVASRIQPLVDGFPGRVGLLRGYGNAIVPVLAARFIRAYMEIRKAVTP